MRKYKKYAVVTSRMAIPGQAYVIAANRMYSNEATIVTHPDDNVSDKQLDIIIRKSRIAPTKKFTLEPKLSMGPDL